MSKSDGYPMSPWNLFLEILMLEIVITSWITIEIFPEAKDAITGSFESSYLRPLFSIVRIEQKLGSKRIKLFQRRLLDSFGSS